MPPAPPKLLTLKQITQLKHKSTWGDIPPLFQKIASAANEIDGLYKQGFDHALRHILNKRNWNMHRLRDPYTHQERKPKLAVYQLFTDWGFEVHCFPYLEGKEVDEYHRLNHKMDFSLWDPGTMRRLVHIRNLKEFIEYTDKSEEPADKALLIYTNNAVNKLMRYLQEKVEVTKIDGISIPKYVKLVIQQQGDYVIEDLPQHVSKRLGSDTLYLLRQAEKRKAQQIMEQEKGSTESPSESEAATPKSSNSSDQAD
ncbi:hypothetical protein ACFSJ3_10155 [Corallincola platygyrae]|uniref:Uncharacterized protein n=1 Tax=Corallincola platygyrae TaxID=1193278 RepID=A0ABW4XLH2_9GAMM